MESNKSITSKFKKIKEEYINVEQNRRYIKRAWYSIKRLFVQYMRFKIDKGQEEYIVNEIRSGVRFRGAQTWVLIFAIFIASLGLNINSTAVIIGAMLISPLMGPIMGIGLGLSISDFALIKRSATNWAAATIFAIITSTIYFTVTPLSDASSELLARTTPTIYDILIALFGGLAGIVAMCTHQRGNVIPGVAIATALMPPLCTVGYGIATLNTLIIAGAFQLFFINSVFIALSTALATKLLNFSPKEHLNKHTSKRVRNIVSLLVTLAVIPAIYITYNMLSTSRYEHTAKAFVNSHFNTADTHIIDQSLYTDENKQKIIEVKLIGEHIPADSILVAQMQLAEAGLRGSQLKVIQGQQNEETDLKSIGNEMFGNIYKENQRKIEEQSATIEELTSIIDSGNQLEREGQLIAQEVRILFPSIRRIAISKMTENNIEYNSSNNTVVVIIGATPTPTERERALLQEWISKRLSIDNIRVIFDN